MLELTHTNPSPSLTGLLQGCEDQFQTALLGPETRDDLGPPLLLDEGSLQQVSGANTFVMNSRASHVGPTGFQVIGERFHRRRILVLEALQQIFGDHLCYFPVRSIVCTVHHGLEFCLGFIRDLPDHVAYLMRQTSLAKAFRPRFLNSPDQPRCTICGHQHRFLQPSRLAYP